jgi:hypothetical protein
MANIRINLLALLALAGCSGPDVPGATAESTAVALNAVLPQDLGFGAIVGSASAEEGVLVLNVDNIVEVDGPAANDMTSASLKAFACNDATYRTAISNGIDIRFDLTGQSGRELPPVKLDHCP